MLVEKIQKLINMQDGIRTCRLEFFKKRIKRAASLFDTLEYGQTDMLVEIVDFIRNHPLSYAKNVKNRLGECSCSRSSREKVPF